MHDVLHSLFQVSLRAVLAQDDLFPVPLVHINRVQIVQRLIAADGIHICHKPVAGEKIILVQRKTLPFCQRVHYLCSAAHGGNVERHRALHAVQVVVQAKGRVYKQRCGHTLEVQRAAQLCQKNLFDEPDGLLRLIKPQCTLIPLRNHRRHFPLPLCGCAYCRAALLRLRAMRRHTRFFTAFIIRESAAPRKGRGRV